MSNAFSESVGIKEEVKKVEKKEPTLDDLMPQQPYVVSDSNMKIIVNIFYEPVDALKKILLENRKVYLPIMGGAARPDVFKSEWVKDNVQMDDVGDNISLHNKMLNEMTSIYWLWKHLDDIGNPKYVGFNHYRRFFNLKDLEDHDDYDIICGSKITEPLGVYGAYQYYHRIEDLNFTLKMLREMKHPFADDFEHNIRGLFIFPCNMFVMKTELFKEYCSMLFPIIFQLESRINVAGRDNYQKRAVCFLGERMTSAWIDSKTRVGCRIKQIPIVFHQEFKNNHLNERGTFS